MASRHFAETLLQDQLNTAIAALVAAISNQALATVNVSAKTGLNYSVLNDAHAKFGDSSGLIVANVMSGQVYHKLIGQNLVNAQQLFEYGAVTVVDILGKTVVVTDAPALYATGTPNLQKAAGSGGRRCNSV